ncbi:MAG: hypothetical protein ACREA8_00330, partial [Nitrosotalea sp.]
KELKDCKHLDEDEKMKCEKKNEDDRCQKEFDDLRKSLIQEFVLEKGKKKHKQDKKEDDDSEEEITSKVKLKKNDKRNKEESVSNAHERLERMNETIALQEKIIKKMQQEKKDREFNLRMSMITSTPSEKKSKFDTRDVINESKDDSSGFWDENEYQQRKNEKEEVELRRKEKLMTGDKQFDDDSIKKDQNESDLALMEKIKQIEDKLGQVRWRTKLKQQCEKEGAVYIDKDSRSANVERLARVLVCLS